MMTPPFCRPTRYYTDALRIIPPQRPYAELLRPFMARSITGGGSKRLNTRIERANVARGSILARLAMRATEKRWSGAPYCMGPCYWRPALIGERGKDPGQPVKIRPERALLA